MTVLVFIASLAYLIFCPLFSVKDERYIGLAYFTVFIFPVIPGSAGVEISPSLPLLTFQKVLVAGLCVAWITRNREIKYFSRLAASKVGKAVYAFFAYLCFDLCIHFSLSAVVALLNIMVSWFLLFVILSTSVLYFWEKKPGIDLVPRMFSMILISSAVIAFFGILYSFTGVNVFYEILPFAESPKFTLASVESTVRLGSLYRAISSIDWPIPLGFYLVLVFPLFLMIGKKSAAYVFGGGAVLVCLFLTQSRGSYIGLFVAGVVYLALTISLRKSLIAIGLVVGALLIFSSNEILSELVLSTFGLGEDVGLENIQLERTEAVNVALSSVSQLPFFGFGLENVYKSINQDTSELQKFLIPLLGFLHTDFPLYITVFMGFGMIGFGFFAYILYAALAGARATSGSIDRLFGKGAHKFLIAGIVGFYAANATSTFFPVWSTFFMLAAIITAMEIKTTPDGPEAVTQHGIHTL